MADGSNININRLGWKAYIFNTILGQLVKLFLFSDWLQGRKQRLKRNYKKHIARKFPITQWLPQYNVNFAISDLIAGLTVGLTVIPQGIAYAIVAGLPPQYGLYSAFMGCFVYCIFGSCKDITIGE